MPWKKGEKKKRGIKTIQIPCQPDEYEEAKRLRGDQSWLDYILNKPRKP
jgi:hypothetical protein